jgi:hypothetical protein
MRGPDGVPVGTLKRIIISNLVSYNNASMLPCLISGIPGFAVEDVKLSDIYIHHRGGAGKDMASIDPPEFEKKYPEPAMFGPLPSHGFYIRHVKSIEMTNIKIAYEKNDARPALLLNDVEDADFFRIKAQTAQGVPILSLKNVKQLQVSASQGLKDARIDHVDQETF